MIHAVISWVNTMTSHLCWDDITAERTYVTIKNDALMNTSFEIDVKLPFKTTSFSKLVNWHLNIP